MSDSIKKFVIKESLVPQYSRVNAWQNAFSGSLHAFMIRVNRVNLGSLPVWLGWFWLGILLQLTLFSCQRNNLAEPFIRLLYGGVMLGYRFRSYAGRNDLSLVNDDVVPRFTRVFVGESSCH